MRAIRRINNIWQVEKPADLYLWLCRNDGGEAVVIDDTDGVTYCSTEESAQLYRDRWLTERKYNDTRRAAMFFELAVRLGKEEGEVTR